MIQGRYFLHKFNFPDGIVLGSSLDPLLIPLVALSSAHSVVIADYLILLSSSRGRTGSRFLYGAVTNVTKELLLVQLCQR